MDDGSTGEESTEATEVLALRTELSYQWDYDPRTDVMRIRLNGPHDAIKDGDSVEMTIPGILEMLERSRDMLDSN
jgi:hypothetical protein